MTKVDGSKKYNTKYLKQKEDKAPPPFSCPKFVGMTVKLRREVDEFNANPIEGIRMRVLKKPLKPPTAEVVIDGPIFTPYEGYYIILKAAIPDDYPFNPPFLRCELASYSRYLWYLRSTLAAS